MTSDDLRSLSGWRDGEPEDAVDRTWFALDVWSAYDNSVDTLVGVQWGGNLYVTGFADEFDDRYGKILRHTPLPDFGAMARDLDDLRAKVAKMDGTAREDSGSAFRVGQVWESPTRLTYRVVGIRPSERRSPALISMRQGADGAGRLFVKRGESTFGWRLMTP